MAGTALGSTPILDRPTLGAYYQSHEDAASGAQADRRLPDHYPLVTRAGTVPVAQLAERGLYSQARYRTFYAAADYAPADYSQVADDAAEGTRYSYGAGDPALAIGDAPRQPEPRLASGGPEPLELAGGPAEVATKGEARMIDVKASLAMR